MQCASGLESIIAGWARIKAGINETVIAGGCEYFSAQFIPEDFSDNAMTQAADNVCRKYGFSPEELAQKASDLKKRLLAFYKDS